MSNWIIIRAVVDKFVVEADNEAEALKKVCKLKSIKNKVVYDAHRLDD